MPTFLERLLRRQLRHNSEQLESLSIQLDESRRFHHVRLNQEEFSIRLLLAEGHFLLDRLTLKFNPGIIILGQTRALSDILFVKSQETNDGRVASLGQQLLLEFWRHCRSTGVALYAHSEEALNQLAYWDTRGHDIEAAKKIFHDVVGVARGLQDFNHYYRALLIRTLVGQPSLDGLLYNRFAKGDFTTEVEEYALQSRNPDNLHLIQIYVEQRKLVSASCLAIQLLQGGLLDRPRTLTALGLLAECQVFSDNISAGADILEQVVQELLSSKIDHQPVLYHAICSADRLVRLRLLQRRFDSAEGILRRLIEFKEEMEVKACVPTGWPLPKRRTGLWNDQCQSSSNLRFDSNPRFSRNMWNAARQLIPLSHSMPNHAEYMPPKMRVLCVQLSLLKNRYELAMLILRRGCFGEARPLLEKFIATKPHLKSRSVVMCRTDLEHHIKHCIALKNWVDAEWMQETLLGLIDHDGSAGTASDGHTQELVKQLQLLSTIYRETGRWMKAQKINFWLLRHHT